MANRYAQPNKDLIYTGLKKGHSIFDMMGWNTDWHQPSRLAVRMTGLWQLYHKVYFTFDRAQRWLNAPSPESVKDSLKYIEHEFELFHYDKKKEYFVPIKPAKAAKETDAQLKLRMQRTIRNQVALGSVVRDLIEQYGLDGKAWPRVEISPHTNREFMEQVQCTEQTVTRYVNQMVHDGYVLRYEGNGRHKSYFVRPDHDENEEMQPVMDARYDPHKPTRLTEAKRAAQQLDSAPLDAKTLARLHKLQREAQGRE